MTNALNIEPSHRQQKSHHLWPTKLESQRALELFQAALGHRNAKQTANAVGVWPMAVYNWKSGRLISPAVLTRMVTILANEVLVARHNFD